MKYQWNFADLDLQGDEHLKLRDPIKAKYMPILHLKKFINEDQLTFLYKRLRFLKKMAVVNDQVHSCCKRYHFQNDTEIINLQEDLKEKLERIVNKKLELSVAHSLMYKKGEGHFPPHLDINSATEMCTYSLLIPGEQNEIWPMNVEDQQFFLELGDAGLYSGSCHVHWRNLIQESNFSNHVILTYKVKA
jgi:hypothetical protein